MRSCKRIIYLYTRTGQHTVYGQHSSFDTVGQHALAMAPQSVCRVRRAHLTCPVFGDKRRFVYIVVFQKEKKNTHTKVHM